MNLSKPSRELEGEGREGGERGRVGRGERGGGESEKGR